MAKKTSSRKTASKSSAKAGASRKPVVKKVARKPSPKIASKAALPKVASKASGRSWTFTALDKQWAGELSAKLPPALFDAHVHLYDSAHLHHPDMRWKAEGPLVADLAVYHEHQRLQLGKGRIAGSMLIPLPTPGIDEAAAHAWLFEEAKKSPNSRVLVLARPQASPESLRALAANPQVVGVKVYHFLSPQKPTFHSTLEGYAPEWLWELCNEMGWILLLHIVRTRALSDESNQASLRRLCEKYPRVKLVLAHAGRGFNKWDTVNAVARLRGLDNVWFDSSGICETEALMAILNEFGPRRLMWGSDFPVSQRRGKCVSVGDRFSWIEPTSIDQHNPDADPCESTLVGLEALRALLYAADLCALNDADRQDLFHDNAARLVGVLKEPAGKGQELYRQARKIIPGGVQLLSKQPEMFVPEQWPTYYQRARGCETWDLDGRHFYDLSLSGIGACLLGFADPDVNAAVHRAVSRGSMSTLNPPDEVELAGMLCDIHPWASQARFARTGGEAMAVAVRIARSTTGRSGVAVCGYHGWADWYLAANLGDRDNLKGHLLPGLDPEGVPQELRGTAHPFAYNDVEAIRKVVAEHGKTLAAIVMEPMRVTPPKDNFLQVVKDLARQCGAVLIFDEITIGWRACYGGVHKTLGVEPDMAAFAKTTSNGFPLGAIIGTVAAMEGAHRSFISSAYWTEAVGPAAGLATLKKMKAVDVSAHARKIGLMVAESWRRHAAATGVPIDVVDTLPALSQFAWKHSQPLELKTLYSQLMLDEGFMASQALYATLAHTPEIMAKYDAAIGRVFKVIAEAIDKNDVASRLRGPVAHSGFRRLVS